MAMMLVSPEVSETCAWGPPYQAPQLVTVRSERSARLWYGPAAIATTLVSPSGIFVWFWELSPQAKSVPLFLRTNVWPSPFPMPPPATAATSVKPGCTVLWPDAFAPQATSMLLVGFELAAYSARLLTPSP